MKRSWLLVAGLVAGATLIAPTHGRIEHKNDLANSLGTKQIGAVGAARELAAPQEGPAPYIEIVRRTFGTGTLQFANYLELSLVNPLDVPIRYRGYPDDGTGNPLPAGVIRPMSSVVLQERATNTWYPEFMGVCGAGTQMLEIGPRESRRFRESFYLRECDSAARVVIYCIWKSGNTEIAQTISSPEIK